MPQERIQYRIDRSESDGLYYVDIKRELNGEWNSMHVVTRATMWGAKFHAKHWIKKWAKRPKLWLKNTAK